MGTAVQNAARDLRKQLIAIAASTFKVKPGQLRLDNGALICGEARMSFREVVQQRFGGNAGELIGRGDVGPEITNGELPVFWEVGMGTAELELDQETGRLSIKRYVSLADVGKAIHPAQCIGQEEGAAMMGIGHTLFEEMVYHDGQLANSTLLGYRVPKFSDVPEDFHTILLENRDGPGPFGARGMGEGGLLSVAPSVTNALARGTGVRLNDLPLTPERVWRALKSKG
jgi:CO/xanthine dehydrogenase Mo-binding subunit